MKIVLGTDRGIMIAKPRNNMPDSWYLFSHVHADKHITALHVSSDGAIYAAAQGGAIYRSGDGENWMLTTDGIEELNITYLTSHPTDPSTMFLGTRPPAVYRSTTNGLRWEKMEGFNQVPSAMEWHYPQPPYTALVTKILQHPMHANVLLASIAQGGFMGSLDSGFTWMERPVTSGREINDLEIHPERPARVFAATATGIYRSDDLGSSWEQCHHGNPYLFTLKLAISPGNPDYLAAAISQQRATSSPQIITFSTNGGDSWFAPKSNLPSLTGQRITALDAWGEHSFAFATESGLIMYTSDDGRIWNSVLFNQIPVRSLVIAE